MMYAPVPIFLPVSIMIPAFFLIFSENGIKFQIHFRIMYNLCSVTSAEE